MRKRKISNGVKKIIWLILATAFLVSGCGRRQKKDVSLSEPNIEPLVFIADYASDAIEATGGMDVWMKTEKLDLVGVVTVYEPVSAWPSQDGPDNSLYLTEHHFEVCPLLNSIRILAQEPLSSFVWQFSEGRFSLLEGDEQLDVAPRVVSYRDYAEAILSVITAPMRLVDESVGFIKEPGPVKMEGIWYYPIAQTYSHRKVSGPGSEQMDVAPVEPYWSKVVFFQNRDSSVVEMVWFAKFDEKKFLAIRGYDYEEIEEKGVSAPTKIEIFETDARAVTEKRLVKIDFE